MTVVRTRSATRLRRHADIQAAFRARAASASDHARIYARDRQDGGVARWTVVASKRSGAAVVRNRLKRRLRAAARAAALPPGVDLVIVARAGAARAPFSELTAGLKAAAAKASAAAAMAGRMAT